MSSNIIDPPPKKSVSTREKVAPSEQFEKGSGYLDDIEDPVVTGNNKVIEELELNACNYSVAQKIEKKMKA